MTQKAIADEKAIIDKIVNRKAAKRTRIPVEKMHVFKAMLGKEIERSGSVSQVFVDDLLRRLDRGEL